MTLTLADANRVIAGAIEKANQIGAKMNIAVCDAGGRLLAFQRMDGAMWAGSFGSQGKAMASAAFGRPSGDLTPRADHPHVARHCHGRGQPHVPRPGGRADLPWRRSHRCLWSWWRHGSGGRGLRARRGGKSPIVACADWVGTYG